ncbi:arsenic efflux protein [Candidatus Woesearchaeota archaeon]|nr:arsenic efflux protein [Candidatus Woesearchaeota archaeon]
MNLDIANVLLKNFKQGLMITLFVFVMMVITDYLNVYTKGKLKRLSYKKKLTQYSVASFLGATPGCLGAFMNVSLYVHGLISFGAIVAGMIATSGDEAFVMLAMFPWKALLLFAILFVLGIVAGFLADKVVEKLKFKPCEACVLKIHKQQVETTISFKSLKQVTFTKAVLTTIAVVLIVLTLTNVLPVREAWKKVTLIALLGVSAYVFITTNEHYLKEHVWKHIVLKHVWRVFLWTFTALAFIDIGLESFDLGSIIRENLVVVLLIAGVLGMIPESGPHLVFVTLFAKGLIPFSILLTSSIVQDGHGMLPLLAYSVKDSLLVKAFNLVFGLVLGLALLYMGF